MRALHRSGTVLASFLLGACSIFSSPPGPGSDNPAAAECLSWFAQFDALIDENGVRDAQDYRVPGFAPLRSSRFIASLRDRARSTPAAFEDWLTHLQDLGAKAQVIEIANLPKTSLVLGTREHLLAKSSRCRQTLGAYYREATHLKDALFSASVVPDAYSTGARIAGLYALSRVPFSLGVNRWQAQTQAAFAQAQASAAADKPTGKRYRPSTETNTGTFSLAAVPRDHLGIPQLDQTQQALLLARFAPVFVVQQTGAYDRLGAVTRGPTSALTIDATQPTVYQRIAHTRFAGRVLVQLVYLAWFPERPASGAFDLLAGELDGVVWRVTLDERGEPLIYDSIHACGCYHLFFPTAKLQAKPAPAAGIEWAFMPAEQPAPEALALNQRIELQLASATHYLRNVSVGDNLTGEIYRLLPEDGLRSLPAGTSSMDYRKSLYGPDGIIEGSERKERYLFWPMGVRSAGAQRQWGHHATAFVGRRHFDDPDLIEHRFDYSNPSTGARP